MTQPARRLAEIDQQIAQWFKANSPGIDRGAGDVAAQAIIIELLRGIYVQLYLQGKPR